MVLSELKLCIIMLQLRAFPSILYMCEFYDFTFKLIDVVVVDSPETFYSWYYIVEMVIMKHFYKLFYP